MLPPASIVARCSERPCRLLGAARALLSPAQRADAHRWSWSRTGDPRRSQPAGPMSATTPDGSRTARPHGGTHPASPAGSSPAATAILVALPRARRGTTSSVLPRCSSTRGITASTRPRAIQPVLRRRENRISRGIRLVCGSENRGERAHCGVGRRSRISRNPGECSESGHDGHDDPCAGGPPRPRNRSWGAIADGRPAQPEEIAVAVEWLVGPEASYVNGAILDVAGGTR